MIYARVHDQTAADDYYAAMSQVEKRLELLNFQESRQESLYKSEREQLLEMIMKLAEPELGLEMRLEIASKMRAIFSIETTEKGHLIR